MNSFTLTTGVFLPRARAQSETRADPESLGHHIQWNRLYAIRRTFDQSRRDVRVGPVVRGGSLLAEPFGSLDGGRMAIVADPAGAVFGVWTSGAHRGAQRVNEPSAYAMSPAHA